VDGPDEPGHDETDRSTVFRFLADAGPTEGIKTA
jgi:hypothetical protein